MGGGGRRAILIDCDPGVDDALALALALVSPEAEVVGVTAVHGNVPQRAALRNARRIVAFLGAHLPAGREVPPVWQGEARPIAGGRVERGLSARIHGPDGLGRLFAGGRKPLALPPAREGEAPAVIASAARRLGRSLTLVALGPLTNLARALRRDPSAVKGVGRIVVMGGSARMPGNATAAAEFNIHCDPEAAEAVLGSGARITLVGLDVTRRAILPPSCFAGGGPFRRAMRDLVRDYAAWCRRRQGRPGLVMHDPLALAAALDPSLLRCERRPVAVECGPGPARGMTVVDLRLGAEGRGVDVALDLDAPRFLRLFRERIRRYRGW